MPTQTNALAGNLIYIQKMRLPAAPAGVGTCEVDGDGAGQLSAALDVVQKRVLHADLAAL